MNLEGQSIPKPRAPFPNRVWFQEPAARQVQEGFGVNISETGIFVQTTDPPQVGRQLRLKFTIAGSQRTVDAVAEVIWVKPFDPINIDGLLPGMGARFVSIDENSIAGIRSYVATVYHHGLADQPATAPPPVTASTPTATGPTTTPQPQPTDHFPLEQEMALQLHGETKPLLGYSSRIDSNGIHFHTDHLPDDSALTGHQHSDRIQRMRGFLAVPVRVASLHQGEQENSTGPEWRVNLNFTDPRQDLLTSIADCRDRMTAALHAQPGGAAAKPPAPALAGQQAPLRATPDATVATATTAPIATRTANQAAKRLARPQTSPPSRWGYALMVVTGSALSFLVGYLAAVLRLF